MNPVLQAPPPAPVAGGGGSNGREPARVPALDGLRGLAILLVLFHHLTPTYLPTGGSAVLTATAWAGQHLGWAGVDLFFALSGFLITGILYDSKGAAHFFRNFYLRRTLRIFPLYYATLVGFFVLLPLVFQLPGVAAWKQANLHAFSDSLADLTAKQPWLWFYGANLKIAFDGTLGTLHFLSLFWTLAVEEHFYLVWPLAVFLLDRRALLALCGLCAVFALALRAGLVWSGAGFDAPYVLTPCRMDGLAIGAAAALLVRGPGGLIRWLPLARRAALALVPTTLLVLAVFPRRGAFVTVAGFTLTALTATALLLVTTGLAPGSRAARVFGGRTLGFFGRYSYGLYVLHFPFILVVGDKLLERLGKITGSPWLTCTAYWTLSLGASVALALVSWHLIEKPFLALKHLFPSGARSPSPAATAASVVLPTVAPEEPVPVLLPGELELASSFPRRSPGVAQAPKRA